MIRTEDKPIINTSALTLIIQILDKVRTLCKQYQLSTLPSKISIAELNNYLLVSSINNMSYNVNCQYGVIVEFLGALDQLRGKIFQFRELQDQYKKLEVVLQKNQTQIRRHIGIQQQFKLYIDTIKGQYEQSENQKLELLDNSKLMINQLKAQNDRLHEKIKLMEDNLGTAQKGPDLIRKDGRFSRNKDRVKSQYCSSLHIRHNRHHTAQNNFISPVKQRLREQDFRIDLTERFQSSKKKKATQFKKRQNYTVMAYMGHNKKRDSKQKGQYKKAFLPYSNKKKINIGSEMKSRTEIDNRVFNSMHSLESIDCIKQP